MKLRDINILISFFQQRGMKKEDLETITVCEFCEFLKEKNITIKDVFERIKVIGG